MNIPYKKNEFDGMQFNPFSLEDGQLLWQKYKDLKSAREFSVIPMVRDEEEEAPDLPFFKHQDWSMLELNELLKYVIILIDTESPLFDETNFDTRKSYAMRLLEDTMADYHRVIEEIEQEGELYELTIFRFFKLINDHDYEDWYSLKTQAHIFRKELRSAVREDKYGSIEKNLDARNKISKSMLELSMQIKQLELRIFPDNDRLKKVITTQSMADSIGGYPEKHAKLGPWAS